MNAWRLLGYISRLRITIDVDMMHVMKETNSFAND